MNDSKVQARALRAVHYLQQAAGIARCDDGRLRGHDVVNLALEQIVRHLGLNKVVDTGATAAPGALGQLDQL